VSGKNKNKLTNVLFIGKKQRLVSFLINTCDIENNNIYKKSEVCHCLGGSQGLYRLFWWLYG
jgi:hypothetical protein